MDRRNLCLKLILLFLCIVTSDCALRMCTKCKCIYKDGFMQIDCTNLQMTRMNLQQIQNNPNTSFIMLNFSKNNLTKVPTGLNTRGVKVLDLSMNNITHLNHLKNYKELLELNVAYNDITDFGNETFELDLLKMLNISHCSLTDLKGFENSKLNDLITLDLSYNKLEVFNGLFFKNMKRLNYLDLSYNLIKVIDVSSFKQLQILNIKNNMIESKFEFPSTLLELRAQNNSITEISLSKEDSAKDSSLVFLYLNQNNLTNLPNITYPYLVILDLMKNKLKTIPAVINNKNCPVLESLILSENEFERFEFNDEIKLLNLKLNGIKFLRRLNQDTFRMINNFPNECINITIKDNPELHNVDNNTFKHLNICYLDLSNNSFSHLPHIHTSLGDWRTIRDGINFQNNPITCDCQETWVLDDFVDFYHGKKIYENLLVDLRCMEPYYLRNYRIVHWYKWKQSVFCEDEESMIAGMRIDASEDHFGNIIIKTSGTMLIVLIICIVFLAVVFIIGLILAKRTATNRSRRNRRF